MNLSQDLKTALKPIHSAGIVGIGKGAQAVMSLGYVALAARTLGVEDFGFLMLIHSLVFGLSQIIRFQTWQAVIRYGVIAIDNNQPGRFKKLIRFLYRLDMLAALLALVLAVMAVGPAAQAFDVPPEMRSAAQIYAISIIFLVMSSTPLGILRLFDRFDLISIQTTSAPFVRFIGALALFVSGGDLAAFLAVWFASSVISRILLQGFAQSVMRKSEIWKSPEEANSWQSKEEGIWNFILSHNLSRSLSVSQPQIAILAVGWMMGPAAAGVFRIAQQFADVLVKPVDKLLIPAVYPELAKLKSGEKGHHARRRMLKANMGVAGIGAGLIFLALFLAGRWIIELAVGPDYVGAYWPMVVLTLGGAILVLSFPLGPLLSAAGRMHALVICNIAGIIVFILALAVLIDLYGLLGAAFATTLTTAFTAMSLLIAGRDLIRKYKPGTGDA